LQEWRVDHHIRRLPWVTLDKISPILISLVVAEEDQRFFQHGGVDLLAVGQAAIQRLTDGAKRGASTITMQLFSLLQPQQAPAGRRTLWDKIQQMVWAWRLEWVWSKEEILEAYLNLVTFRGELQGISTASRGLFDKESQGLTRPEALLLTVLMRAPNASPNLVSKRACRLATRLALDDSCDALQELAQKTLSLPPRIVPRWVLAPHASRWAMRGKEGERRVTTTLDERLQHFVTEQVRQQIKQLQHHHVSQAAVLVVDTQRGEVVAYVGNVGEPEETRYVDGVQALRSAGSTLKPFLYQLALEKRYITPATLLLDGPLDLLTPYGLYVPQNYDRDFKGWVSARTALASSLNVPAVRLLQLTGLSPFQERLHQLGIDGLTEQADFYGYAMALGGVEVRLWSLTNAFRTLARGGIWSPLTWHPQDTPTHQVQVMHGEAAALVTHILADPVARSLTFGLNSPLATPFWSAAKTGTSKEMRDNWCIGFTSRFTVGVWVGNFDGSPMRDVSGVTGAALIWSEIMRYLHPQGEPPMAMPGSLVAKEITFQPPFEARRWEWFLPGTQVEQVLLAEKIHLAPRIDYPKDGQILAWDGDIPPAQQRLLPRMTPFDPSARWRIDGNKMESSGWQITIGHHQLELLDKEGEVLERVKFHVRGRTPTQSNR
ncbi:MAG: penicillin-binding protein 1C, partial [Magnetococcales bacterium]|nr:penicillin-binding protein 1C [Magnetococcales bacterium]